ncbi:MAG: DUF87 domain-containing protein [Euryarchaeota archaeon]|nr:DUF87 domain-containing protein [Euryarchaeota archaeon]
MRITYLGNYGRDPVKVSLFLETEHDVVISALSANGPSVIQAFKKFVLKPSNPKNGIDYAQLSTLLQGHNTNLEIHTTKATIPMVERVAPPRTQDFDWLANALKKLDRDLAKEKREYDEWKGVRDLDEAKDHFHRRREEIFDLNQKIVSNLQEPHFAVASHYVPSHAQTVNRFRLDELRDRAKERHSTLKQRIDFTRRNRIQELEKKRAGLVKDIEAERKTARARDDDAATALDEGIGVAAILTIRSGPILARGKKNQAIGRAFDQVLSETESLRAKLDASGVTMGDADPRLALSSIFAASLPGSDANENHVAQELNRAIETAFHLQPRDVTNASLSKMVSGLLGQAPPPMQIPTLDRFPSPAHTKGPRLTYLGLALSNGLRPTTHPMFYNLDEQGPRHTAVIGGSGSGKSVTASLIVEGALLNKIPVLVMDPTRSWTGFLVPASTFALKKYERFSMKPEMARPFELEVRDSWDTTIEKVMERRSLTILSSPNLTDEQEAGLVDQILGELLEKMKTWPDSKELRLLLVLEEAHRYLRDKKLQPTLELFARTARAKGVGLMAVSQNAIDLPPAIRNNCATVIQMNTHYGEDLKRAAQTFGSDFQKTIPKLQQGQGAFHYPEYGSTFVAFRPPLHNHHAASEAVVQFFSVTKELKRTVDDLFALQAVPDEHVTRMPSASANGTSGTESTPSVPEAVNESLGRASAKVARDWHDVVAQLAQGGTRPRLMEVRNAITAADLKCPSRRSIYRHLRQLARQSNGLAQE